MLENFVEVWDWFEVEGKHQILAGIIELSNSFSSICSHPCEKERGIRDMEFLRDGFWSQVHITPLDIALDPHSETNLPLFVFFLLLFLV